MKFKNYLAESSLDRNPIVDQVYQKAKKYPDTYLDTWLFRTMDELENELGGRRMLLDSIKATLEDFAKQAGVDPVQVAKGYLDGKFPLTPDDNTTRKIIRYFR